MDQAGLVPESHKSSQPQLSPTKREQKPERCSFRFLIDKQAQDYLDRLVSAFKSQGVYKTFREEPVLAKPEPVPTSIEETANDLSKFEGLMMETGVLHFLDRPKYCEVIQANAPELKEHLDVFKHPKKFDGFLQEFRD